MSVEPDAVMVTEAAVVHEDDPPLTVGMVGSARSILAVAAAWIVDQPDQLPATSPARNWTSVVAWTLTGTVDPSVAADQVPPLSVEVRY